MGHPDHGCSEFGGLSHGCRNLDYNVPFPPHPESKLTQDEVMLEEEHFIRIIRAFSSFASNTQRSLKKYNGDYEALSEQHQKLIPEYAEKLSRVEAATLENQKFYDAVIAVHRTVLEFQDTANVVSKTDERTISVNASDVVLTQTESESLRSLLRQVMRDWSDEGAAERQATYAFLYTELDTEFPNGRGDTAVLVPGAGLGRLAYEISQKGTERWHLLIE
ncbi:CI041 protein [Paramicrosporidium saccamoebae]|uniref:CI041 protein n=1 Tax=Paramicrosporidium saccamoebae TaxID=1246581 RepID=A0A2H9TPY0_9FUNG|nr:CI041 protein [Paramicrosporidium saccamoebae]